MTGTNSTHITLLKRLASEGPATAAWHEFCDRYGELIRAMAMRQGVPPADVDDVLQDVLMSLTRSLPKFEYDPSRGKFRSYLKTIVLHAIFRKSRQKRGERNLEDIDAAVSMANADPDIDRSWEAEWRQYHLAQAMKTVRNEFNASDMAAFEAYAGAGRSAQETAEALNMSVDQVYQAKSRILKRLSQEIAAQVGAEG